jgi:adenylate cyclase
VDDHHAKNITNWLMQSGLKGLPEEDLLAGFCERCNAGGLQIDRASAVMDTLHPVYERRAYRWDRSRWMQRVFEFGFANPGGIPSDWQRSAFHYLKRTGGTQVRRRLLNGDPADFFLVDTMKRDGFTDFIATAHRFDDPGALGGIDCFFSQFGTRVPDGFSEADEQALRDLLPCLALAVKCVVVSGVASTIAKVYLGEGAANHVLHGRITRGRSERISAALWFSDLANFTRISDTVDPEEIIPMLNDYSDAVISSIEEAGGEVLKLMGDGTLAIFRGDVASRTCAAALDARALLDKRLVALNAQRSAEGRPVTDVYLGLHVGDVFYGNIGSQDRLDFTVIGPAVNEVSRIASLCRPLERKFLMSAPFAAIVPRSQTDGLQSIGSHVLRGVSRAQELFTMTIENAPPEIGMTSAESGAVPAKAC